MGNSNIKILKKKNKKQSIELMEKVVDLLDNEILDDFDKPDVKKVLGICKAIKVGKFTNSVKNHFGNFKYPLTRLQENIDNIDRMNKEGGWKQPWYDKDNDCIKDYLGRYSEYSDKILEKYQAANRDATIDALLED